MRVVVGADWELRGGTDPDAAALTNVLVHRGVGGPHAPLTEPLLFLVGGGLGAGYILWEFAHQDSPVVTLGFTHSWQYADRRLTATVDRLGLDVTWSRTGGAVGAARELASTLAAGDPAIVWPDRYHLGYWHLPPSLDGHGGHPVVAYAAADDRVHVDDRTLAPLTVATPDLDRARARVGSYRHLMLVVRSRDAVVPADRLRDAVRAGLRAGVDQLGGTSTSFALPAWRGLFGDGLEQAASVLDEPRLVEEAQRWRTIARRWDDLAETVLPDDVAATARLRTLTATVGGVLVEGDAGAEHRAAAAEELWRLRAAHADEPPLDEERLAAVLGDMSEQLGEIHAAETEAVGRLGAILGR